MYAKNSKPKIFYSNFYTTSNHTDNNNNIKKKKKKIILLKATLVTSKTMQNYGLHLL